MQTETSWSVVKISFFYFGLRRVQKFYFTLTHLKRWLGNDDEARRQKSSKLVFFWAPNRVLHVLFSPTQWLVDLHMFFLLIGSPKSRDGCVPNLIFCADGAMYGGGCDGGSGAAAATPRRRHLFARLEQLFLDSFSALHTALNSMRFPHFLILIA